MPSDKRFVYVLKNTNPRVDGELIPLALGMDASTAQQLAHDRAQTLGGVQVSGGRRRPPSPTTTG
jgi:hypothetical protein